MNVCLVKHAHICHMHEWLFCVEYVICMYAYCMLHMAYACMLSQAYTHPSYACMLICSICYMLRTYVIYICFINLHKTYAYCRSRLVDY